MAVLCGMPTTQYSASSIRFFKLNDLHISICLQCFDAVGWAAEGHPACKKYGGWWRRAVLSPDGVAPSPMVGVSASVNLPMHIKSRSLFWQRLAGVVPEKGP